MKYAELDDRAKERAREWYNRTAFVDSSDWEHVYADAVTTGALMGIDIDTRVVKLVRGTHYNEPDINFSGFCSQGDGACFSATLLTGQFAGAVERVKAEWPTDEALHAIADEAEAIHVMLATYAVARRLDGHDVDTDDYPECGSDMRINIESKSHRGFSTRMKDDSLCPSDISEAINTFVEDFAGWIYSALEAEYEHQTDDNNVAEGIIANGYDFDENGNID